MSHFLFCKISLRRNMLSHWANFWRCVDGLPSLPLVYAPPPWPLLHVYYLITWIVECNQTWRCNSFPFLIKFHLTQFWPRFSNISVFGNFNFNLSSAFAICHSFCIIYKFNLGRIYFPLQVVNEHCLLDNTVSCTEPCGILDSYSHSDLI